jgi:hypothetical protein
MSEPNITTALAAREAVHRRNGLMRGTNRTSPNKDSRPDWFDGWKACRNRVHKRGRPQRPGGRECRVVLACVWLPQYPTNFDREDAMPLDAIAGKTSSSLLNFAHEEWTLTGAVGRLGLAPIPAAFLAVHREDQVRRHPPSFLYSHRWIAPLLTISSFAVSVAGAALVGTPLAAITVILAGMLPALGGIVLASRKVRAEAYWVERRISENGLAGARVPRAIRETAYALKREFPPARLILGELRQDTVVLDPYLIAEYGDDRVVLGIWDGSEVIACAGPGAG